MADSKRKAPKLRFPGFNDDWEQRKLGDLVEEFSIKSKIENAYTVLSSTNSGMEVRDGRVSGSSNIGYKVIDNGDLVLSPQNLWIGNININDIGIGLVSPSYKTFKLTNIKDSFFKPQLRTKKMLEEYKNASTQGASVVRRNLEMDSFYQIPMFVPNSEEQEKIGSVFKQLDNLITLHQRKLSDVQKLKSGLLQKMFPKNGEKVPEIRFPEFSNDWEQRKWINTVDISKNMVDPRSGEYDELLHIGPGNIEPFTGRILDNVKTVKVDNLISGKFHFNPNDIIYGKINPQLAKYAHVNFEGLASADAYILNAKNGVSQNFLYVELQTSGFYRYSVSVSMRTGMPKINRDELNQFSYLAPKKIEEQNKIGAFFNQLDNLITLHQRKLEHLQQQKKALLQQMFI